MLKRNILYMVIRNLIYKKNPHLFLNKEFFNPNSLVLSFEEKKRMVKRLD